MPAICLEVCKYKIFGVFITRIQPQKCNLTLFYIHIYVYCLTIQFFSTYKKINKSQRLDLTELDFSLYKIKLNFWPTLYNLPSYPRKTCSFYTFVKHQMKTKRVRVLTEGCFSHICALSLCRSYSLWYFKKTLPHLPLNKQGRLRYKFIRER